MPTSITASHIDELTHCLQTNEVNFGLDFQSQIIGAVLIGDLLLIPGENNIETEVRYMPQNPAQVAAGKVLLENFIQNIVSDVVIAGTPNTTPYGSLQQALGSIRIMTSIPPIDQLLITRAGECALWEHLRLQQADTLTRSFDLPDHDWPARSYSRCSV